MTRKVWDFHSEVYVNPFKTIQNVLLSSSAWSKLSMSCVFSLPLETSLTALARHLVKVLTSYSHFFGQGKMGLKFICRKMISAHLGKLPYLESISRKIPNLNFSEFCVFWIQIHRNTSQASNVTNKRHILNQSGYLYGTILC